MRKMITSIAAILAVSALMVGAASAADKLVVKGTDGTTNILRVDDTGLTEAKGNWSATDYTTVNSANGLVLAKQPVLGVYNGGLLRMSVRPGGITKWLLSSSSAESGSIEYQTPGGGVGISFFTGATYDQNRFDFANYPTLGTGGNPMGAFGYVGSPAYITLDKSTGNIGFGLVTAPTAKLDVDGNAVRIRTSQTPVSTAACNAGTIAWDTGYIYLCTASGAWKRAALSSF